MQRELSEKRKYMKLEIVTHRDGRENIVVFDYTRRTPDERPMVLDVLLQAQETTLPDLSFRFGCRARNCGVCTIEINGKPRIACRARAREGDRISAMSTLPVVRDLVVRRDGVARQMRGRPSASRQANDLNVDAPEMYHHLTACIECYACLDNCPMHARNFGDSTPGKLAAEAEPLATELGYRWGNPFSLLKLQRIRVDPLTTPSHAETMVENALDLGLEVCSSCPGCKCGVGIDLKNQVVNELLKAAEGLLTK